ncbi:AAA family ATPase [Bradyrhizobium sp. CCGB20]|nr:AAA family ATPase [Bradyrhizobium sp. CCGB20]MCP3402878.1 AAA family ATPase [Bradyrhizobium sp. CCGB20]
MQGLAAGNKAKEHQLIAAKTQLRESEKRVTSVQPTVSAINTLLMSLGFSGFKLSTTGARDHLYEIVRDSGDNAAATPSEGEKVSSTFSIFIIYSAAARRSRISAPAVSSCSTIRYPV